jgi:FkbH-like protein
MAEPVRLVVWDLDETFWRGTLTEGGIAWRDDCAEIVVELARRGIMNSICSKNDFEAVKTILTERAIWDYFIFPSIDWSPKGARVRSIIESVQLRPQSVMLIDDNHLNLEEARFFSAGIQVASDDFISEILSCQRFAGKEDRALTRLNQYKVLETRKADEERQRDTAGGDNVGFLMASDIRVRIVNDVEAHLDRAIELINRTNQLNFIKRRLPEDVDLARQRLRKELSDFSTQAGLIEVSDKYGDYGFCGYFQVTTRREVAQLQQFCFSCRILDMGVEAWVYQRLGKPMLEVQGEVLSDPISHPPVDWIRLGPGKSDETAETSLPALGSVAARGGCILWPLVHYFRLTSERVIGEFNTIRDGNLIMLDRSICLRNAIAGITPEQLEAVAPLGYVDADFKTEYFEHSGDKPLWILSNWTDLSRRVYRHKRTGIVVPANRPNTRARKAFFDQIQDYITAEFTHEVVSEADFKETLAFIFSRVPKHGIMFLLQMTETEHRADGERIPYPHRRRFNRWCAQAAAPFSNVRLVSVADFVHRDAEILNHNNTHFDRQVYHRLYLHIMEEARADLARIALRPIG